VTITLIWRKSRFKRDLTITRDRRLLTALARGASVGRKTIALAMTFECKVVTTSSRHYYLKDKFYEYLYSSTGIGNLGRRTFLPRFPFRKRPVPPENGQHGFLPSRL
jgi:hypothetical protein